MHKISLRIKTSIMKRGVAKFIQSCFGELKVSNTRCSDCSQKMIVAIPRETKEHPKNNADLMGEKIEDTVFVYLRLCRLDL